MIHVWNETGLDNEKLDKGELIEIKYVKRIWRQNGKEYRNFLK